MFRFKQFSIDDSRCGMKLGTDSVALGAWVDADGCRTALDVGAGSGVLALMLAQRYPELKIHAVELDDGAAQDCADNFAASPWIDRLSSCTLSFDDYRPQGGAVDLIISNPPYFKTGQQAPDGSRAAARHEGSLSYATLLPYAARWLSDNGALAMVLPSEFMNDCQYQAMLHRLYLRRVTHLSHSEGRPAKRILLYLTRHDGPATVDRLAVQSPAFKSLTEAFYLDKES